MARPRPEDVRSIAGLGGGPIGGGWTAHFLARGYDVCDQGIVAILRAIRATRRGQ